MIISPRKPVTKTIVVVSSDKSNVYIKFPETNEDFKMLIKNRHYFWDGWDTMRWRKKTKLPNDRHCDIVKALLENGFIVESNEEHIVKMQSGNYEPESLRWIKAKGNHFRFCWYRSEDCYNEVRKLPASKYDKPCVIVPMEYYEDVIDFADINGFKMTPSALSLVEKAKQRLDSVLFFDNLPKSEKPIQKTSDFTIDKILLDV